MIKGISISGKHSFDNFGEYIKSRNIGSPAKRTIKHTVPFMHSSYDFSDIGGEIIYDEREIAYTFDIANFTIEEMIKDKGSMLNWLMRVFKEKIYDDYIPGHYFYGSYDSNSWKEEAEQGELTVKFKCYPFIYQAEVTKHEFIGSQNAYFICDSSHRILADVLVEGQGNIKIRNESYSFNEGITTDAFFIYPGQNDIEISTLSKIVISYRNEVFECIE